jgi:EAL domain-containing protein (putative c-di-GMP-specific phosphodiesterase class I)
VILESSLQMAKRLRLTAVAEGVETQADWDLVKSLGCDLAQGFAISPPLPAPELRRWLANGGWRPPGEAGSGASAHVARRSI